MEAFELRLWDGRLGRWLTVDPYYEFSSPYLGMGNNPISLIDPDGGSTDWHRDSDGNLVADKGDNAASLATYLNISDLSAKYVFAESGFEGKTLNGGERLAWSFSSFEILDSFIKFTDLATTFNFGGTISGGLLTSNLTKSDFLVGTISPLNEISFTKDINGAQFNFYEKGYKESLAQINKINKVASILSQTAYIAGYYDGLQKAAKGDIVGGTISAGSNYIGQRIALANGFGAGLAWAGTWEVMDRYISKTEIYNRVLFGVHSKVYKEREKYWWKSKSLKQ
jgi:hypothetical protein